MQHRFSDIKKIIVTNIIYVFLWMYLLLYTGFMLYSNNLSITNGTVFLLFQIGCILLPGTGIVLGFCKDISLSKLELLMYSYASGYIFNIVLYFLLIPFQLQKGVIFLFILLDCYTIYKIKKRKTKIYTPSKCEITLWVSFIILITLIILIIYCGNNLLPTAVKENAYYTDLLFWSGDAIELSHNFPPNHFRNVNESYFYHYFSSIQIAVMHLATGLNITELTLVFAPVQSAILLVSAAFLLFKEVIESNKLFYSIFGMIIMFFTTGNELYTSVNYVSHMYKASFGFDISTAFGMFALYFFIKQFKETSFNKLNFFMTILCYIVCLGAKGPIGAIILVLLGIICLYYFLLKKQYVISAIYGGTLLIVFALLACFILISRGTSVASTLTLSNTYQRLANTGYIGDFFEKLYSEGVPWIIARIIQVFYFAFVSEYAIAIIFFIGIILKIIDYKKIDIIDIACVIVSFLGCVLTLIVAHPTFSQTYFMMAVYPYATLFGIKSFSDFNPKMLLKYNKLKRLISILQLIIFGIAIILGMTSFTRCYYFKLGWNIGIANYRNDSRPVLEICKTPLYNYVSSSDYEAYVWIRENTDWQDLFTSNLCLDDEIVRPYCLGAFSERHVLMNDLPLIEKLMTNNKYAANELKEKHKIDYVVCYKQISPEFNGAHIGLNCVFENNSIAIYCIK